MGRTSSRSSGRARAAEAADNAVAFFRALRHSKGRWAGQPFELLPWQEKIIRDLFGTLRPDGKRQYRTAYIEVPRKAGKSTLSAGIALLLLLEGEPGAEVYSAAADRDQASIVFAQAKAMVEASPVLQKACEVYRKAITVPRWAATYKALSADVPTKHGLNAHGIVFDELHAQTTRDLWDVLTTSTGARDQPLTVAITTAGYDRNSICWEQHEYARQVAEGVIDDPTFYGVIFGADEKDDWMDPKTWRKANPSLGDTVQEEYYAAECARARQVPAYQNTFRRLLLNQWTAQESRWLDLTAWDETAGIVDEAALAGRECYAGLDLASTTDIAALVLVFPPADPAGDYQVACRFWIPAENMRERERRDRVPYSAWSRDGFVKATPGNVIDYGAIEAEITDLGKRFDVREIAFDRWGAAQISQNLTAAGFTMVPFGQGFASMSAPTKELLKLVLSKRMRHGGNPVLRWMADNLTVRQDPAGNVKPDKGKSRQKIDGMVALVMGLDRAIRHAAPEQSVYETRGVLSL